MDIIIFCGQSNMQGQSERITNNDVVQGAYEYKFVKDCFVPLRNPVGEDISCEKKAGYAVTEETDLRVWLSSHITGSACYGNTNLVPEFCKEYIKNTGNEVVAVHIAKGSTEISYWLPSQEGYEILVKKVKAAITKLKKEKKLGAIFFVWLQGESDAIKGNSKAYYKQKLKELSDSLIKEVKIEKFGIIRVGRFTNDDRDLEIISAQDELCKECENFLMLTDIATELNLQGQYMNPFIEGHYSAEGLEKLGFEAGRTLGMYASNKKGRLQDET